MKKQKSTRWHTPKSSVGMGEFTGTAIKNKMAIKKREVSPSQAPSKITVA